MTTDMTENRQFFKLTVKTQFFKLTVKTGPQRCAGGL